MRFKVGDEVWIAEFSPLAPTYVTCPSCGGTGRLRVIFHDDTEVSIECRECAPGYDPPTGRILVHQRQAKARKATVTGMEVNGSNVRWHLDGTTHSWRIGEDAEVFDSESDAWAHAQKKADEFEKAERERIQKKEKDTRTWAWNASYHRRQIKEAQRQLEYHTAKLNVAALKAKSKEA